MCFTGHMVRPVVSLGVYCERQRKEAKLLPTRRLPTQVKLLQERIRQEKLNSSQIGYKEQTAAPLTSASISMSPWQLGRLCVDPG